MSGIKGLEIASKSGESGDHVGIDQSRWRGGVRKEYDRKEGFIKGAPPGFAQIKPFTNPLFDQVTPAFPSVAAMASVNDGGDHGGSGEDPTCPKSARGRPLLLEGRRMGSARYVVEEVSFSNWHPPALEGLGVDEEDLLVGEVDMEDDVFVEEDPDVAPAQPLSPWRLMARYVGQSSLSAETLKTHYTKVWRLRKGATFAPIKPKWFIVTLNLEGDYNFVVDSGPWIHLGDVLLVQPLKGSERPSETDLNAVPIWVKMYDVPWDKQTVANGRKWGSRLGKVDAVDVDNDGSQFRDFLRVRIQIPINKRLQTKLTTGVKGKPETHSTYILRYERVPYFYFWCGFIGHNDTVCEKKRLGVPSLGYDANLRCSPMRKFQYRPAFAPPVDEPFVKRGLDFSNSDEYSGTLGKTKVRNKARTMFRQEEPVVPETVDARDGFERSEAAGDQRADVDLSMLLCALQVQYPNDTLTELRERMYVQRERVIAESKAVVPVIEQLQEESPPAIFVHPIAMQGPLLPRSSDMIPPLRGLCSWVASEDSADTDMSEVNSVLGKRLASCTEESGDSEGDGRELIVHDSAGVGSAQKGVK
ncbi:hypothetical protein ACQ4PT_060971 [Festuca glaucescens]